MIGKKGDGMDTFFITGGAGFIGSSLIDRLLEQGHKVVTIDNLNEYYDPRIKHRNIFQIKENMKKIDVPQSHFCFYEADIRSEKTMEEIFQEHSIDVIIHLAAMAGVRASISQPKLYYDVNIMGTLNLLETARKHKVNQFIFASSSSVYGNSTKIPFSEDDAVEQPISPYAASKRAGELLCYTYYHLYGISLACLRFFTVYGPRQRPDLAIHKFAKLMMDGQPIPFYGDGTTERDYTYIDDIIDGIDRTIQWIKKDERQYEIFNLGESTTVSLSAMVKTLEAALGKKAIINQLPPQPGDVKRTFAEISKAKKVLGYSPQKKFEDGIQDFIQWFKDNNVF